MPIYSVMDASNRIPGKRHRSPEVQELLDGLMYMHALAAGLGKRSRDQAGMEAQRQMKAWFGSLHVEERIKLLQLQEPAMVKLLIMLASKARALPPRRGRRMSMVKFFVFAESVPALAVSSAPSKDHLRLRSETVAASDAAAAAATAPWFENEPFVVRPDESRQNAWGDHVRLATPTETWQAWEALTESLLLVPPQPTPEARRERRGHEPASLALGIFSSTLVQDVDSFFSLLNDASAGCFLQGGMADAKTAQEMLGETAWFRSKGDYSLGELLANKIELLLCRAWHAHRQKCSSKRMGQSTRALTHPSIPSIRYLEERRSLAQFLFEDLSNSQVRLRCVVFAVAKVIRALLQEEQTGAAAASEPEAFALYRRMLEVLLLTTQLHLFRQEQENFATAAGTVPARIVQVMALDSLFTTALTDCSEADVQRGRFQALLRMELLERRTAWHQQRLFEEYDVLPMSGGKGQRTCSDDRITISTVLVSAFKKTNNKKKKKRRNKVAGAGTAAETPAVPGSPQESMLPRDADKQEKEEESEGRHFSRAVSSPPCLMSSVQKEGSPIGRELEKSLSKEEGGEKNRTAMKEYFKQTISCSVKEMATQTVLCGRNEKAEEEAGKYCGHQAEDEREGGEKEKVVVEVQNRVEEVAGTEEVAVVVEVEEEMEEEEDASSMTCDDQQGGWGVSFDNSSSSSFTSSSDPNRKALGAASNETNLKDLCLKLEAEVATLRGVLAVQRGALSQDAGGGGNKYPSYSATPPHGFEQPSYGIAPAHLHLRHLPPHQHPLFSRHVLHHMEIMSDDGRGDGGGDSAGGWQGEVSQPRASPFPPTSSTATVYSAEGTKQSIVTTAATLGTMGRLARLEGGGMGGAFAVSLPRNPSGPLHVWGERHHLHHQQEQQPQHQKQQQHHQPRQAISASVSLGGDDLVVPLHPGCPPVSTLLSSNHHHPEKPGLRLFSAGLDLIQHERGKAKHEIAHACSGFTLRQPLFDVRSRLCDDIVAFVRGVSEITASRLPQQTEAINRCRQVVQSLWPRAQVKAFGSFVSGLALPSSDVDLVICLPKVRRDAPAEAPGVLEGRNAIKETWQQELARRLRATAWVNPASIKIISHTAIPVIKMKIEPRPQPLSMPLTGGGGGGGGTSIQGLELRGDSADEAAVARGVALTGIAAGEGEVYLDVSIEGGQHNGLLANQVIAELLRENPALRPLVLVLKHFMKERGLMESYSGGLSSYGLVLMVARYLQEQSNAMDTGSLLLGFLDFYSNHFDPRTMGVSTNHRCYFSRGAQQQQHQQQHQHHPQHMPSLGPHRRVSLGGGGDLEMPEYYIQQQEEPQQQQQQQNRPVGAPFLENPYKFDPLYLEDPICPSNNIGRNCFRIFQIQRAWNDAWQALDPGSGEGAPRLNRMLSTQEVAERGA
ncbi:hypothetical protein VYU27_004849 [Nannochloropsis oceanica]